jgi:hypothetical protein
MPTKRVASRGARARRTAAVTTALVLSAIATVVVSGTSRADTPGIPLSQVTDPAAQAVAPLGGATSAVARAAPAATPADEPAAAAAQAVATTAKPVTSAAKPIADAVAATAEPLAQPAANAAQPVGEAVAGGTAASTKVAGTAGRTATQAPAAVTSPAAEAVATAVDSVQHAAVPTTQPVARIGALARAATQPAPGAVPPAATAVGNTKRTALTMALEPVKRAVAPAAGQATETVSRRAGARARTASHARVQTHQRRPAVGRTVQAHVHAASSLHVAVVRRIAGGRAAVITPSSAHVVPVAPIARSLRVRALPGATAEPAETTGALSAAVVAPPSPSAGAVPPNGGSDDAALALATLIGAGGVALLRARQFAAGTGLHDPGTLTALGHAASTFWAGSCISVGSSGPAPAGVPLTASASPTGVIPAATTLGGRAQFGVAGALSNVVDGIGGRVAPATSLLTRAGGSDRTALVTLLLAASAAAGAALGGILPRRHGAQEADVG